LFICITCIPAGDGPPQFAMDAQKTFHTRLCRYYGSGQCTSGSNCKFAHSVEDLRIVPDLTKTSMCRAFLAGRCPLTTEQCPFAHCGTEIRYTADKFKTHQCRFYATPRGCRLGSRCRYAHGDEDLRPSEIASIPWREAEVSWNRESKDGLIARVASVSSISTAGTTPPPSASGSTASGTPTSGTPRSDPTPVAFPMPPGLEPTVPCAPPPGLETAGRRRRRRR